MIKGKSWPQYASIVTVGVVLSLIPPAVGGSPFYMRLATVMLAFMAYTVAFNIIFGHTRQLFLCLGALSGSSAYLSVVLTRQLGLPPWESIPLGVLLSGSLGAVFSYVSVRRGLGVIFLGIVTLAFSLVFHNLLLGLRDFTRGETGIVTRELGFSLMENRWTGYYIFLAILLLSLLLYYLMVRSSIGLAFRALSDDELTAELAGIDVTRYKVLAAFTGSALIGTVGAFYAYYNGFIGPEIFSIISVDTVVLVMLMFGGMGTLLGPVLGGAIFTVVNEIVRPLGPLNLLVYGAFLVILFVLFREGLVAAIQRVAEKLASRKSSDPPSSLPSPNLRESQGEP